MCHSTNMPSTCLGSGDMEGTETGTRFRRGPRWECGGGRQHSRQASDQIVGGVIRAVGEPAACFSFAERGPCREHLGWVWRARGSGDEDDSGWRSEPSFTHGRREGQHSPSAWLDTDALCPPSRGTRTPCLSAARWQTSRSRRRSAEGSSARCTRPPACWTGRRWL